MVQRLAMQSKASCIVRFFPKINGLKALLEKNWFGMSQNYITVHVTGTSALDIAVARTQQIPVIDIIVHAHHYTLTS